MKARAIALIIIAVMLLAADDFHARELNEEILYKDYLEHFNGVQLRSDISENGFRISENQIYDLEHKVLGNLTLIPAISEKYNRLAFFFSLEDGSIVFKTTDFESNSWLKGRVRQTNHDIICIVFSDLNGDGLEDIVVISTCKNESGLYADKAYNVGDVLFQNESGFYRDYRISDKINRFDMNKNYYAIIMFVRDGISAEFLFTAKTVDELLENGMQPINSRRITEHLEKFGVVEILPGFFNVAGQNYLMIYIIDANGDILWNFQPMHYYVNFYEILEISFRDIDSDGNKDFTVLGRYATYDDYGKTILLRDYDIYYQRAGYFLEDIEFKLSHPCGDEDGISEIIDKIRKYKSVEEGRRYD